MKIIGNCVLCTGEQVIEVPTEDYIKWRDGTLIQNAMPYLEAGQREFLISRICEKCFDDLFKKKELVVMDKLDKDHEF